MRNTNIRNSVLPMSLFAILTAAATTTIIGCGTGSGGEDTGAAGTTGAAGSSSGAAGTTGAAGTNSSGAAGTTGAAGSSSTGVAGTTGAAGSSSTGAAGTAAPPTTGVCAGEGSRMLALDQGKVDDFEEDAILAGWSSFNDVQPTGNSFKIAQDTGGAIGTAHSGHYTGTGAKTPVMGGYGVGTIYNMAIDKTAGIYCVDVANFDGLSFWAKAAKAGTKIGVNFVVPESNAVADGGDCTTGCYNHPQKQVTLTTEWQQYTVLFSAATGGTGAKIKGRIQEIGFLSPDADWDFSVDELQLYKGTAPTTAVGGNSTM